jgi:hypothetical protein
MVVRSNILDWIAAARFVLPLIAHHCSKVKAKKVDGISY